MNVDVLLITTICHHFFPIFHISQLKKTHFFRLSGRILSMPGLYTVSKWVFIAAATAVLTWHMDVPDVFLQLAVISLTLCLLFYGLSIRFKRVRPVAICLLFLSVMFFLLSVRTRSLEHAEPFSFFSEERKDIRFTLHIDLEKKIGAGVFLAAVQVVRSEKRNCPFRFRRCNYETLEAIGHPVFQAALLMKDASIRPGCHLFARMYVGRKLHEPDTGSFGTYLRSLGARAILRPYQRDVLSVSCAEETGVAGLRQRLSSLLSQSGLKGRALETAEGLVFGESHSLDRQFKDKVRKLGILHVFAASGMHLAFFFGVIYFPLSRVAGKKHPLVLFAALPICVVYVWVLGFPVSLCRALIFVFLYAFSSVIHRQTGPADLTANTCVVLIIAMPDEFLTLSGLLSTGAAAGILFFGKTVRSLFPEGGFLPLRFLSSQMALTISAGLFISPILVWCFGGFSFSSIWANLIIVPLSELALPVLYLALILSFFGVPAFLSGALWSFSALLLDGFCSLAEFLSEWSLYREFQTRISLPSIVSVVLVLLLFLIKKSHSRKISNIRTMRTLRILSWTCALLLGPAGAFALDGWSYLWQLLHV